MAKQDEREQVMTTSPVTAVSYYLPEDSYLPGMIRPHTYKGWHAYWKAYAPNRATMTAQVVGPYATREDALSALYNKPKANEEHRAAVKEAYDRRTSGKCYYGLDGTLLNADGTRSIFDDVDE